MCYKHPGPRCSAHATRQYAKRSKEYYDALLAGKDATQEYAHYIEARIEWEMTPAGFRYLEGKIATMEDLLAQAQDEDESEARVVEASIADLRERLERGKTLRAARLAELKSEDRGDVEDVAHQMTTSHEVFNRLVSLSEENRPATSEELENMRALRDTNAPSVEEHAQAWDELVSSEHPSHAIRALFDSGLAEKWYPELHAVKDIPQSPQWHPEGAVGEHIAQSMDVAARNAAGRLSDEDRKIVVLAALCHDLGKVTHTQIHDDGRITSRGHDIAGVEHAKSFLARIGADERLQNQVGILVATHMRHIVNPTPKAVNKLALTLRDQGLSIDHWAYVADADTGGRGSAAEKGVGDAWRNKAREQGLL